MYPVRQQTQPGLVFPEPDPRAAVWGVGAAARACAVFPAEAAAEDQKRAVVFPVGLGSAALGVKAELAPRSFDSEVWIQPREQQHLAVKRAADAKLHPRLRVAVSVAEI